MWRISRATLCRFRVGGGWPRRSLWKLCVMWDLPRCQLLEMLRQSPGQHSMTQRTLSCFRHSILSQDLSGKPGRKVSAKDFCADPGCSTLINRPCTPPPNPYHYQQPMHPSANLLLPSVGLAPSRLVSGLFTFFHRLSFNAAANLLRLAWRDSKFVSTRSFWRIRTRKNGVR